MKKNILLLLTAVFSLAFFNSCKEEVPQVEIQAPRLISIVPQIGYSGCTAIISGVNFSVEPSQNIVKVDGEPIEVRRAERNRLELIMPDHEEGTVNIEVMSNNMAAADPLQFTYKELPARKITISSIAPAAGSVGCKIKIYGENFSTDKNEISVKFDDIAAEIVSASETMIEVLAPEHPAGTAIVTVQIEDAKAVSMFKYTKLEIKSNFPASGPTGTEVTIAGEGFSLVPEENVVKLNGKIAEIKSVDLDKIVAIIPENPDGTYEFELTVNGKTVKGGSFKYAGVWMVETVVGSFDVKRENKEGQGLNARLDLGQDIILGTDGNYFLTVRGLEHGVFSMTKDYNVKRIVTTSTNELLKGTFPWGGDVDSNNNLYFCAKGKGLIMKVDADGNLSQYDIEDKNFGTNTINLVFDKEDNMYILHRNTGTVVKVKDHKVLREYTLPKTGKLYERITLTNDQKYLFVLGDNSGCLHLLNLTTGEAVVIAGNGTNHTKDNYTDGTPGQPQTATIGGSDGACMGKDGTYYFTDFSANTVRRLIPGENGDYTKGTIETIAGIPFETGTTDGPAYKALLNTVKGIALAPDGQSLLLFDGSHNMTVRKISYKK